jgi:hypothetical protein
VDKDVTSSRKQQSKVIRGKVLSIVADVAKVIAVILIARFAFCMKKEDVMLIACIGMIVYLLKGI